MEILYLLIEQVQLSMDTVLITRNAGGAEYSVGYRFVKSGNPQVISGLIVDHINSFARINYIGAIQ